MPINFTNRIPVAKNMIRGEMAAALNRAAVEMRTNARLDAPVRTRRLRRSIRISQRATERRPTAIVQAGGVVIDGVTVDYAAYVELGTVRMAAQPYFFQAIEHGKRALMEEADQQARARGPRGRAGVQHADTPAQLEDFFLNEGVE
jgi:HK97 gp10 family phage protein